jgi:GNAT superfamily N-acetyltransferase
VLVAKAALLRPGSTRHPVTTAQTPSPDWAKCWLASGARDEAAKRRALLARLPEATVFALARTQEEPMGIGLAVIEREWAGIFAMQTAAPYRGQGVARALLDALIARAGAAGANRLYLQVEQDNAVAQRLYLRAGFGFAYSYHYRTRWTA